MPLAVSQSSAVSRWEASEERVSLDSNRSSTLVMESEKFYEASRPVFASFMRNTLDSPYEAAISDARRGNLHFMFCRDYPQFRKMPSTVAAGFLMAHMGVRRGLDYLRCTNLDLFRTLRQHQKSTNLRVCCSRKQKIEVPETVYF